MNDEQAMKAVALWAKAHEALLEIQRDVVEVGDEEVLRRKITRTIARYVIDVDMLTTGTALSRPITPRG